MELDFERCYRAVDSRDQRFDGWFYTAVKTTGIYCRPSCPAVTPKPANVAFYPSAAAAQRGGYRACRRCRPDAAPGSPEWDVRADLVGRAMRLIGDGVVDREGVPGLAVRLGYTERHLHRMLTAELGAGPLALARAQRAQTARILIETTDLTFAEIAFAAGFGSVRQFNDTILEVYAQAPNALRSRRPAAQRGAGTISLRLAYRPPLHAGALLSFLAARALPGVEECDSTTYRRSLHLPHGTATVELTPAARWVDATLRLTDVRDLAPAVARCRRLLDLDADPTAVDAALRADPALGPSVAAESGVRVPRAVDGFEMAVRAIVGQQVSVTGARTTLTRLLAAVQSAAADTAAADSTATDTAPADTALADTAPADRAAPDNSPGHSPDRRRRGRVDHAYPSVTVDLAYAHTRGDHDERDTAGRGEADPAGALRPFPTAAQVVELPDEAFRMPVARRESLRALARAAADGDLDLDPGADRADTVARLTALPGIGAWTAGYVAMRAIGDPDVLLHTDLAARRGARALGLPDSPSALQKHAERWRPWRSYALVRLWRNA